MRTCFSVVVVPMSFAFLALAFGCSDSSRIAALDASQSRPEWSIELKSTCADTPAENCLAAYGYSLGADGNFRVGPGPQGQTLTGKLSDDEFKALQKIYFASLASARARSAGSSDAVCTSGQIATRAETDTDQIQLVSRTGEAENWIDAKGLSLCSHLSTPEDAKKIYDFLRESAENHYPSPFPDDACDGATSALEAAYASVQDCHTDADCAYFDDSFQPIAKDRFTFLVTNDCSGAMPLVVGNISSVSSKRVQLLQSLAHAKEACKKRSSQNCSGFSDFQPTAPAPVCSAGICHARRG